MRKPLLWTAVTLSLLTAAAPLAYADNSAAPQAPTQATPPPMIPNNNTTLEATQDPTPAPNVVTDDTDD